MLNEMIQEEPATAISPEIGGLAAAIGLEKGKPFSPDEKTKAILNKAVEVANADEGWSQLLRCYSPSKAFCLSVVQIQDFLTQADVP